MGCCFNPYPSSLQGRRSLFPAFLTRVSIGFPCGQLSECTERARAYHVSRNQPCRLGAAYPPAVMFVHVFPAYRRTSDCTPFGSGLSATLAWFPLTTFNSDLLTFTILHKPSSPAGRCFQLFASASRFRLNPFGRATFSRHAASRPLPAASVTIGYC